MSEDITQATPATDTPVVEGTETTTETAAPVEPTTENA